METKTRPTTYELLEETQGLIQQAKDFLIAEGEVVELDNLLTIKRCYEKHGPRLVSSIFKQFIQRILRQHLVVSLENREPE